MKMILELLCEDEGVYSRWTHFSEWYRRSVVFGESLEKIEERQPRNLTFELETIALYSWEVESLRGISVIQLHKHTEPQMTGGRVILTAAGDCRRGNRRRMNSSWGGEKDKKESRIANRDIQLVIPGKKKCYQKWHYEKAQRPEAFPRNMDSDISNTKWRWDSCHWFRDDEAKNVLQIWGSQGTLRFSHVHPHENPNTPDISTIRFEERNRSPLSSLYHQRAERFICTVLSSLRLRDQAAFFGEEKCINTTFSSMLMLSTCSHWPPPPSPAEELPCDKGSGGIPHRGRKYREVSLIWKSGFRRQRVRAWKVLW